MLAMITPCESPTRSPWHLVSGVAVLMAAWTVVVAFAGYLRLL